VKMPTVTSTEPVALRLDRVSFERDGNVILSGIDWEVRRGERWVLLGRNGSGKTSMIRIASLYEHPSSGIVEVLGERLGRTDVRILRTRIGLASPALADQIRPGLSARDVVMCGLHAALEPWWHHYDDGDRSRATEMLDRMDVGHVADHAFGTLSSGERQRVLLARQLMVDPGIVLLDEPTAGLDLAGREELVEALDQLAASGPAMVLVTHHVEEIPTSFTHVVALRRGRILAKGPIRDTLTADVLSECFELDLELTHHGGRWSARRS
jgi:iron complex transport system ATP-binding protein